VATILFFGKKYFNESSDFNFGAALSSFPEFPVDKDENGELEKEENGEAECVSKSEQIKDLIWALAVFDHPVLIPQHAIYIASKLDIDISAFFCDNLSLFFRYKKMSSCVSWKACCTI
jgi:hypothetical protein